LSQRRVFTREFKVAVAQRILGGESVSAIHYETGVKRSVLYRWRDAYRKEGETGLRSVGRPAGVPGSSRPVGKPEEIAAKRIAELERKIGQQALEIDFLARAFKRVKEDRQRNTGAGGPASTEGSEK
jgi:transposase-like protein